MLAFVTRFERLHALTAYYKASKANAYREHDEMAFETNSTPFTLPLWDTLQGFSYTSQRFTSHAWATSTIPLANTAFVFKLPTPGVNLHVLVQPFCSGYETHFAHLSLHLSLQA
jgi:hypothetical protein